MKQSILPKIIFLLLIIIEFASCNNSVPWTQEYYVEHHVEISSPDRILSKGHYYEIDSYQWTNGSIKQCNYDGAEDSVHIDSVIKSRDIQYRIQYNTLRKYNK